jgi:hypothetical protein
VNDTIDNSINSKDLLKIAEHMKDTFDKNDRILDEFARILENFNNR